MSRRAGTPAQVAAALLTVWVLWGSTFLGIRVLVGQVPPLLAAGARFTLAGALLLALVARRRPGWPPLRERLSGRLPWLLLLGVLHFLVANGLVSLAERRLPSAAAGAYFATVPLWSLAVRRALGERLSWSEAAGAVLGVSGVAVLLGVRPGGLWPSVAVLAAAAVWAAAGALAARPPGRRRTPDRPDLDPFTASAVQMLGGGGALLVAATVAGEWGRLHPDRITATGWLAGGHLVLLGSIAGFAAYIWLVQRADPRLAGTYAYVNPVVATLLGVALLHERLTPAALGGVALITVAVALALRRPAPRPAATPALDLDLQRS